MAAFKWTGAILVLFSAGGLGIWSAMQWKGRLRMLEILRPVSYTHLDVYKRQDILHADWPLPACGQPAPPVIPAV